MKLWRLWLPIKDRVMCRFIGKDKIFYIFPCSLNFLTGNMLLFIKFSGQCSHYSFMPKPILSGKLSLIFYFAEFEFSWPISTCVACVPLYSKILLVHKSKTWKIIFDCTEVVFCIVSLLFDSKVNLYLGLEVFTNLQEVIQILNQTMVQRKEVTVVWQRCPF